MHDPGRAAAIRVRSGTRHRAAGETWLEPGEYTLTSRTKGRDGTAKVVIGREEGPLVRITIR